MIERRDELRALAPEHLERHRVTRYRAEEIAIPLQAFDPPDRETIVALYAWLGGLAEAVAAPSTPVSAQPLLAYVASRPFNEIVARVQRLGREARDATRAAIIHDLRGGAFLTLVLEASSVDGTSALASSTTSIAFLVRDHRKMMRGLVADLDPARRAQDLAPIPHRLSTMVEALRGFPARAAGRRVDVDVGVDHDCVMDPIIAESCVEFGAVDRILYNLLNNAVRHADPPRVSVSVLRVSDDLRVVVENGLSSGACEALVSALELDCASLFGSFTTVGSGRGLQIVAYLVGSAYGVPDVGDLVRGGYVGARLQGERFAAWFHWPLAGE